MRPASATPLIPELQVLRAAGCLLVFFAHAMGIFYLEQLNRIGTPRELVAHAVLGFFILSGLVLALPYVGKEQESFNVGHFYYERLLRLYPAYLVSVLFALCVRYTVCHWVGLSGISPWVQRFWGGSLSLRTLMEHLFPLSIHARVINPIYWTLCLEIQACLLFPAVVMLVRNTRHWVLSVASVLTLIALSHFLPFPVIRTLSYFLTGAYVAKYNPKLKALLLGLPASAIVVFMSLLGAFFWFSPRSYISHRLSFLVLEGSLALLMVAVQAFHPLASLAKIQLVQRLAELSYCFYLIHLPILAACVLVFRPSNRSAPLAILAAFILSVMLALICHEGVEQPIRKFAKSRPSLPKVSRFWVEKITAGETNPAITPPGA